MNEDVYVLKKKIRPTAIVNLENDKKLPSRRIQFAIQNTNELRELNGVHSEASLDEINDWIAAIKSGKKIVNPMSPRDEIKKMLEDEESEPEDRLWYDGWKKGIIEAVKVIAKEHPDVGKWLKEDDQDD